MSNVGTLHRRLTQLAARYLLRNGCELVATEFSTRLNGFQGDHIFDAIGLDLPGMRVSVVEAKTSRGDFKGDPKIWDARDGYAAVAERCYLVCPQGLVSEDELPAPWGLIHYLTDAVAIFYRDTHGRRQKSICSRQRYHEIKAVLPGRYTHTRKLAEALVVVRSPRPATPRQPLSSEWHKLVRAVGRKLSRHYLGITFTR
jgi:hypothetical protein